MSESLISIPFPLLILLTHSLDLGVAGILTIYSMSSLIIYNRRQRALWIDREVQGLLEAKQAYVAGAATQE